MSTHDQDGGSHDAPAQRSEGNRPSDRQDPVEKSSKRIAGELSNHDRESLVERTKDERDPEKRLSQRTTGRGTFGDCSLADIKLCGADKGVSVQLKNGLPERIETSTQCWDRDAKNPQIWHVQTGDARFDLKADVRLQGDDITARVKYENGREVTFKNGEPSLIVHPGGEKWTRDPGNPGRWDISAGKQEDAGSSAGRAIQDVRVNPENGSISWNVKNGAGRGQIDEHGQCQDLPPLPKPVAPEIRHYETPSPVAPHGLKAEALPPLPKPVAPEIRHYENPSPVAPAGLKAEAPPPLPKPMAPEIRHYETPSPAAPPALKAESAIPLPKPLAPEIRHLESPSPVAHAEKEARVASDLQRQAQPVADLARSEFTERAQAEASRILAKIASASLPLPHLHENGGERQANALPVARPAVLSPRAEAPLPPALKADQHFVLPAPSASPLEPVLSQSAPQPMAHKSESYFPGAPGPVDAGSHSRSAAPEPVPVETYRQSARVEGPAPVRATGGSHPLVEIVPSVSAPVPAVAERAGNLARPENQHQHVESAGQSPGVIHRQEGIMLTGGIQEKGERQSPAPYPAPRMFASAPDGSMHPLSGSAEQNRQALQAGVEARAQHAHREHSGAHGEIDHFLTGGGNLDQHNRFEVQPGALNAGVEQGHRVIVQIYNHQSGQAVLTGEAYGHLNGLPGAPDRTLVIDGPPQWRGKAYNLSSRPQKRNPS